MYILSVESTCDETAVAVTRDGREVLADVISSQADMHALYGGVVPEIASRSHIEVISRLADEALRGLDASPAHRITTTQRDSLVPLAVAVQGLTVVPAALARTAPAYGGRVVPLPAPVRRAIGIVHRRDALPNPALQGFLTLMQSADPA